MNLHVNRRLFADALLATAQYFDIQPIFIEKDYWITRSLKQLAEADAEGRAIFKGGTSLSKAHLIGSRFSEDIDVAIVNAASLNGNQRKTLIRRLAKAASAGLEEVVSPGVTSKGSSYYRAIYGYTQLAEMYVVQADMPVRLGQIMLEINSFANPYPFEKCRIGSFIGDFLSATGNDGIREEYGLNDFSMNVLDKRRTAAEKIVSLLRFSLANDYTRELAKKIRHFYDLYFLATDPHCAEYFKSSDFANDINSLIAHDRALFDKPEGWSQRSLNESPLFNDLLGIWKNSLWSLYESELSVLAYKKIPSSHVVIQSVAALIEQVRKSVNITENEIN